MRVETKQTDPEHVKITQTDQEELSGPALRAFFWIANLWGTTCDEQMTLLGVTDQKTFDSWRRFADSKRKKCPSIAQPKSQSRHNIQRLSLMTKPDFKNSPSPVTVQPIDLLEKETLERISYIVGIYKALHILLPGERAADKWVKLPNTAPLFEGKPALDRMLSGKVRDLRVVRQYLDAQRGSLA